MRILTLSESELASCRQKGRLRNEITSRHHKHRYGFQGDGELIHEQGCISEYAVSKEFNLSWTPFAEDFKSLRSDVGSNVQVRATTHPNGNLILHPSDPDDQYFILVRLHAPPSVHIIGWIIASKAKLPHFWRKSPAPFDKRPCYVYPATLLKDFRSKPLTNDNSRVSVAS